MDDFYHLKEGYVVLLEKRIIVKLINYADENESTEAHRVCLFLTLTFD